MEPRVNDMGHRVRGGRCAVGRCCYARLVNKSLRREDGYFDFLQMRMEIDMLRSEIDMIE